LCIGVLFTVVFPDFIIDADGLVPSCFRWFVLCICYILFIKSIKIVVIDGHVYARVDSNDIHNMQNIRMKIISQYLWQVLWRT
jgi:hypothetical protein